MECQQAERMTIMPAELSETDKQELEKFTCTHRYSRYLIDLQYNWAYENRVPGRNGDEKRIVRLRKSLWEHK